MKPHSFLRNALVLLASVSLASAQTVLVNFGSQSTTNWNSIGALNGDIAAGSVIGSDGSVLSGVSITTDNFQNSTNNSTTPAYASSGAPPSWMSTSAATTTWIRGGGASPATIVISGLNDSLTYNLDIVSARNTATSQFGQFTANGLDSNWGDSTNFSAPAAWTSGAAMTWNSLAPVDGTITITTRGISSSLNSYTNALRLTAVPEPSACLLLTTGLSFVVIARRRQRG